MAIMADARMRFYNEQDMNEKQQAAAKKLPVENRIVSWTQEEEELFSEEQKFLVRCRVNGATYITI